jgi:hypothetical protein
MPARIVHGTPYCCPTFLYQNRKFDGMPLAGLLSGAAGGRGEERVRSDQDGQGQQAEAHDGEQADDADHQDPRRALLPGRARLGFGADQELVRHD